MIINPTVLILGAGASAPYYFPSGRALLMEIVEALASPNHSLTEALEQWGTDSEEIEIYRISLRDSMQPSVDAFLEKRPEYLTIGKFTIAGILIPYERESIFQRGTDRKPEKMGWYEYLFQQLDSSVENFTDNKLSVLTFNYDRSLEHFLMLAIKNSYGLDDAKAFALLKTIPIIHLYGSLGEYSYTYEMGTEYSLPVNIEDVFHAADSLKIMSEGQDDSDEFCQAHRLLQDAEQVALIGFGYHKTNVRRLAIKEHYKKRKVIGTALGLEKNERKLAVARMGGPDIIELADKRMDALSFLRNWPVFE